MIWRKWFLCLFLIPIIQAGSHRAMADEGAPPQDGAATIEWALANCDHARIPAMTVSIAALIVNGSTVDQMKPWREEIRRRVAAFPSSAAACDFILSSIEARK